MYRNMLFLLIIPTVTIGAEKIRYMSTEHPNVTYFNTKYITYFNVTSKRYGRADRFYYVGLHAELVYQMGHNVSVHFYFYEYLSNVYKRSFVEMHYTWCDLVEKDLFFGTALRKEMPKNFRCPYPSGPYHFYNMTVPINHIPHNFPFRKGRIYLNTTSTGNKELLVSAHIDMEIKETHVNKKKPKTKP